MADDKFVLFGLNDDTSGIAEVLKNKTCKKILDCLAEVKEASEQDIAKSLEMPINTIEYNIKKLIKAGLVDKSRNFFWSVKGRKINMYKLAKKHIIISPSKKPSLNYLKSILPVILIALTLVALIISIFPEQPTVDEIGLKRFQSEDELKDFLKQNFESEGIFGEFFWGIRKGVVMETIGITASVDSSLGATGAGRAQEYSTTNIQVEGVDEADIVKNDGKYIYVVSGNKVAIVDAYPAENMKISSEIDLDKEVSEIFINDDKLIVFVQGYNYVPYSETKCLTEYGYRGGCGGYSTYESLIHIYNVEDRENPVLEQNISADGNYIDSRMIGDYIYIISNKYITIEFPEPPVYIMNGVERKVAVEEVYYWPYPDESYVFTSIMALNVKSGDFNSEVYLTGSSRTIYVSQNNIYLTYEKRMGIKEYNEKVVNEVYLAVLPEIEKEKLEKIIASDKGAYEKQIEISEVVKSYSVSLSGSKKAEFDKKLMRAFEDFEIKVQKENEKTIVHKINVDKLSVEYEGQGEVPGKILNQFSMDEYDGNFRIATTTGGVWEGTSLNHLYILDENLEIVGKVEDLAHGEKIYSTRFLGKRAYIVTFKKVDPLFVIDVENPEAPKVLGYLKITGYSDYLHPYDENHIIGIGKETIAASEEEISTRGLQFAWYQGIKISLFDVSDVANPKEKAKIEIGDRGTDSDALYEHKAFLFDKKRNLLVIPISLAEINKSKYRVCNEEELKSYDSYSYCLTPYTYGETVWQGVYVLNIDLEGISLRGKITHDDEEKERYYYGGYAIKRSLYMDNILYTISQGRIKANSLQTIEEINEAELSYESVRRI